MPCYGRCLLGISVRAFNGLSLNHINTIGKLAKCSEDDLLKIRNFGQNTIDEIKRILKDKNLHLGMAIPEECLEE
jgi:DNA-directed RNA polymerase subunit alpha